jgi:hypothetical protein
MTSHIARIILVVVVALNLSTVALAQLPKNRHANNSIRLQKDKPSVYISFVRFGKRESFRTVDSENGVYLRLHNNTRWTLVLQAYGAGGYVFTKLDAEEMGMFYGVEEVPTLGVQLGTGEPANPALVQKPVKPPDPYENCEVALGYWSSTVTIVELKPGKSFLFSLPREALCRNLRAYILYQYNWEKDNGSEPEHRVYFYGSDLPKETAKK